MGAAIAAGGDAIVIFRQCGSFTTTRTADLTAPGWTIVPVSPLVGANGLWELTFGAIAPDTATATFSTTWPTLCDGASTNTNGDELANVDQPHDVDCDGHAENTAPATARRRSPPAYAERSGRMRVR